MARIIKVTYGTHGKSAEYTYITNKNLKNGDVIQPSVRHYQSGKIFGTTAVVQHSYKPTGKAGSQAMREAYDGMAAAAQEGRPTDMRVQRVYTASELGISAPRGKSGRYIGTGIPVVPMSSSGKYALPDNVHFVANSYARAIRQGNVDRREGVGEIIGDGKGEQ